MFTICPMATRAVSMQDLISPPPHPKCTGTPWPSDEKVLFLPFFSPLSLTQRKSLGAGMAVKNLVIGLNKTHTQTKPRTISLSFLPAVTLLVTPILAVSTFHAIHHFKQSSRDIDDKKPRLPGRYRVWIQSGALRYRVGPGTATNLLPSFRSQRTVIDLLTSCRPHMIFVGPLASKGQW